ncbi:unnamed protein product [Arabis nemorensis]|uniref:Uncharacterized protein n=1 Tax=Arabis nemorensis TaxID=586526 RepID=A0A565CE91_9BRAS|nr:unnamed protein product [Arabis nemorensis]
MIISSILWLIAPPVQKRSVQARFITKRQEVVHEKVENGGGRRKTLDSRFAIMKEQRKRYQSNKNYSDEVQVPRLPPWARARRFLR